MSTFNYRRFIPKRIRNSKLGYKMASGACWSLMGAASARGLNLISSIILARMMGKAVFGELGVVQSTLNMFVVFAGFSLGTTATKYIAEFRHKDPERAGRIAALLICVSLVTGGIMASMMAGFAPMLAERMLAKKELGSMLRISSVFLFITAMIGTQNGILAGLEAFRSIALRNLVTSIATFPLVVFGARYFGLAGAIWGMVLGVGVNWTLNLIAIRHELIKAKIKITLSGCRKETRVLFGFSIPSLLTAAMGVPVSWLCNSMLVNRPSGYLEMGIFTAAFQWQTSIVFVPNAISVIILPLLSNLHGNNDKKTYKKVFLMNALMNGLISLTVATLVSCFSPSIMALYGPGFRSHYLVLVVLAFSAVFTAMGTVASQAIASKGRMWVAFLFNILWAVATLTTLRYTLAHGWGAYGLSWAYMVSYMILCISLYSYAYRLISKQDNGV